MTVAAQGQGQTPSSKFWNFLGPVLVGAAGYAIYSVATAGPACSFGDVSVRSDTFYVNGALDYGFVVSAPLNNTGSDGSAVVSAQLTTSEGTFERQTRYFLKEGQTTRIQFDFTEPTISVGSNVQAHVQCD